MTCLVIAEELRAVKLIVEIENKITFSFHNAQFLLRKKGINLSLMTLLVKERLDEQNIRYRSTILKLLLTQKQVEERLVGRTRIRTVIGVMIFLL